METRSRKLIKAEKGYGKLFEVSEFFDNVSYNYYLYQEIITIKFLASLQVLPGAKELSGTILLHKKQENIVGRYFRLEISNNESFNITVRPSVFFSAPIYFFVGAYDN